MICRQAAQMPAPAMAVGGEGKKEDEEGKTQKWSEEPSSAPKSPTTMAGACLLSDFVNKGSCARASSLVSHLVHKPIKGLLRIEVVLNSLESLAGQPFAVSGVQRTLEEEYGAQVCSNPASARNIKV